MRVNLTSGTALLERADATSPSRGAGLLPSFGRGSKSPGQSRPVQLQEVDGNLTFTSRAVTAWFVVPERPYDFRPDSDRTLWITAIGQQLAGLLGARLHLRRTTVPYPVMRWSENLARISDPIGRMTTWWADLDAACAQIMADGGSTGLTMLGVSFPRQTLADLVSAWRRGRFNPDPTVVRQRIAERAARFAELLAPVGLEAVPATELDIAYLLYRSIALGMAPPANIAARGPEALLGMAASTERYRSRYGKSIRLVNRVTREERFVVVLTAGRMGELEIPERHVPWMHLADQHFKAVELSSRVDVLGPDAAGGLNRQLLLIRHQQGDYREHGLDPTPELERLAQRALEIADQVATGRPVDSTRVNGYHRFAVAGATEKEALELAEELKRLYEQELRLTLQHPKDQHDLALEFVPGEPVAATGYLRRLPALMLAAAMPQAAPLVGDGRGPLLGRTMTGGRPVMFDTHYPMERRERSGLAVLVAEPGGGKSTLMGAIAHQAVRRGIKATLLDPSGPLARLADVPALRGHVRVLDLAGSRAGTLAPYAMIPTPVRHAFAGDAGGEQDFHAAVADARSERRELVVDIITMLLPAQVARADATASVLRRVLHTVPAEETSSLDDVVDALERSGPAGQEIADLLRYTKEMPLSRLLFGLPQQGVLDDDVPLTVITMPGLQLPDPAMEREFWTSREAFAVPLLFLAQRLAVRRCYGGDMHTRKLVGLDESHVLEGWRSGRSFLVRLARDSRKWNLAALIASQNPRDILGLDVQNLVSTVFVGRIADDAEVAAEALRLLRLPESAGYEQLLAGLSQAAAGSTEHLGYREFLMRDVDGRVQGIRVDLSYAADLLRYLNTTPGGAA